MEIQQFVPVPICHDYAAPRRAVLVWNTAQNGGMKKNAEVWWGKSIDRRIERTIKNDEHKMTEYQPVPSPPSSVSLTTTETRATRKKCRIYRYAWWIR